MTNDMLFQDLSQFALEVELHDSDIQNIVCNKTEVILYLDGLFLTSNSSANSFYPSPAYIYPAKIILCLAEITSLTQRKTFYALLKNKSIYFEIITSSIQAHRMMLEGRYYSDDNNDRLGYEAEIIIDIEGEIRIEWDEISKEG